MPTIKALALSLLFVVLGLFIFGFYLASVFTSFDGPASIPLVMVGMLFLATGLGMYYSSNEQLMISRESGVAFVRSWHPSVSFDKVSLKKQVEPDDIIAIQTISRVVKRRSNRSARLASYTEYQVNLCTSDRERYNLFITLKPERAEDLETQLALMFNVPV